MEVTKKTPELDKYRIGLYNFCWTGFEQSKVSFPDKVVQDEV